MKLYQAFKYAVMINLIWPVAARAQIVASSTTNGVVPLQPPSILETKTGTGFLDIAIKWSPAIWALFGPLVLGMIQTKMPQYAAKIPKVLYPMIVAIWGAIGGLFAGTASLGMDGGGVSIDYGMAQGAVTGGVLQGTLQANEEKVVPVITKVDEPKKKSDSLTKG